MGLVFFDNLYTVDGLVDSVVDGITDYGPTIVEDLDLPPIFEFRSISMAERILYASPEKIIEWKHSPFRTIFSLFYGFASHFSEFSHTRQCAKSVEESEASIINLALPTNPTIGSYSKLIYYMLSHARQVTYDCAEAFSRELSKLKTYITMHDGSAAIGTVDYWLQQD